MIERVRSSMTPGQRWTAALGLLLATLLVRFGLPPDQVLAPVGIAAPGPALPLSGTAGVAGAPPVDAPVVAPSFDAFPLPPGGEASSFVANFPAVSVLTPPHVVALVRSGGALPGRDDAAIAATFLAKASFAVTTIVDDPADANVCTRALASGRFVVASTGVDPARRDCLLAGGATVLSFDDLGAAEGALSTRRGIAGALLDTVGVASGRVGIVAGARVRPAVTAALDDLADAGMNVVDVVTLADDVSNSDVADAVRRFAGENIEVVVFAVPVARQRQWLGPAAVLMSAARYVVADAYDAVVADEAYPPSFDGAVAMTSVRTAWFERTHGETVEQRACRTQWEAAATPPKMLGGAETVDVYAWCEHVDIVTQVLERAVLDNVNIAAALASLRYDDAPLTSPLHGDGPTAVARLVWHASCGCWQEQQAFAPR